MLRTPFRSYKRVASRLRDGLQALGPGTTLQLKAGFDEAGTSSEFDEAAPIIRIAALLRPFMSSGSPIEVTQFWATLISIPAVIDEPTLARINHAFSAADRLLFPLVFNNRTMTARDIYFAYAEGEFFDEQPQAKALLDSMSFMPIAADLVRYLFHNACVAYARLALLIIDVILGLEKQYPTPAIPASIGRCIYCLDTTIDADREEHVIPEAFGVDELTLRGADCESCKESLSLLDQYLVGFEPIAFLRVLNVPLTKKGKFPHADFREFKLQKVKPRVVQIVNKTKKDVFPTSSEPNGTFTGRLHIESRPINMLRIARALFKIGFGVVAHDAGAGPICDTRFDATRAFIHAKATMPNHLIAVTKGTPTPAITAAWQATPEATAVELSFFGVTFVFNLEATPFNIPKAPESEELLAFWLGEETENGIVPPCRDCCVHSQTQVAG